MYHFKTKAEPFARGYLNCESTHRSMRLAAGMYQAVKDSPLCIDNHGLPLSFFEFCIHNYDYGCSLHSDVWYMEDFTKKHPEDADEIRKIHELIAPHLTFDTGFERMYTEKHRQIQNDRVVYAGGWLGHAVPDYQGIFMYGTNHYRAKIQEYREKNRTQENFDPEFYDALLLTLDTIELAGQRFTEIAERELKDAKDPHRIAALEKIISTFDHAPSLPCRDFAEAVIVYVMVFTLDGIDSPGHIDQFFYDLWTKTEPALRQQYLEALWEFFHDHRVWNVCLSGSDEYGNDLTNDLTYAYLDLIEKYRYETPNVTLRWHRNTPNKLKSAVYHALTAGTGLPALYNDHAVVPALERLGIPKSDAHTYVMNGCNQIDIPGKSHQGLEDGQINIAKVLELTLHNGISNTSGNDLGLHTGDAASFPTFDAFYEAFLKQLDHFAETVCEMANMHQRLYAVESPNPLRSILIEGCIEKGLDYKNHGPIYGNGQILFEGIADTADSLAIIKKYIYEENRFTMAELIDALDKNYEGYEEMLHTFRMSELKFGNDIPFVDQIAANFVDRLNAKLLTLPTFRGGHFSGGCSPFNEAAEYGMATGSLPNGKKRGESLFADSIGATPGFDTNGPTALINSCLNFDHTLPGSGFILNTKFDKDVFLSEEGEQTFLALWSSYFERGGQMMTVTVVSDDELRDAQLHPENHRNLIVRVGGYSDVFVNLDKELQENVIARTSHCKH